VVYSRLIKLFPHIRADQAKNLSIIWEKVVTLIFEEVQRISSPEMTELHIDLKEEVILEHAKLRTHIVSKVVEANTEQIDPNEINHVEEEHRCFGVDGHSKILNTGKIIAENIWLRKYHERWKLKTRSALVKENKPKKTKFIIKEVNDNHFIPKSFIRKYWSKKGNIRRNTITGTTITSKNIPFSQWGFVKNLYSDRLEAYFGLIEGDASIPIQKVLNVEPLNYPQKKALIGFIVIQRFRNPAFIKSYTKSLSPKVIEHYGVDKANDPSHQREIYESLYNNNDAYAKVAQPLNQNQWVLIRSPNNKILLPDICNIFSNVSNGVFIVVPLTYKDCLFILPDKSDKSDKYSSPRYVTATHELEEMLLSFILHHCGSEFLSVLNTEISINSIESIDKEKLVSLVQSLSHRDSKL
jgi:hypothetical protein